MPARNGRTKRGRNNYYKPNTNNVECDRTGFKMKSDQVSQEWNGFVVRNESFEQRQPQDLLRGFPDRQQPAISRPGTGDRFLSPGDVTADDL